MLGRVHARCFRASAPRAGGAHNPEWLAPDHNTWATHINHRIFMPIVYMCPVALVLSPSMLAMPLDLAMGVLIPVRAMHTARSLRPCEAAGATVSPRRERARLLLLQVHAHCNANMIISDYAHWITKAKWFDTALRMALVPVTGTLTRARPQYASFRFCVRALTDCASTLPRPNLPWPSQPQPARPGADRVGQGALAKAGRAVRVAAALTEPRHTPSADCLRDV